MIDNHYLHAYLLIYARLFVLDLLLDFPETCSVWCSSVRLQYLDIPDDVS